MSGVGSTEPPKRGGAGFAGAGAGKSEAEERLVRAEALLEKIEELRQRLEGTEDPDAVIEVLQELAEVAKQAEGEIAAAKRAADART